MIRTAPAIRIFSVVNGSRHACLSFVAPCFPADYLENGPLCSAYDAYLVGTLEPKSESLGGGEGTAS